MAYDEFDEDGNPIPETWWDRHAGEIVVAVIAAGMAFLVVFAVLVMLDVPR